MKIRIIVALAALAGGFSLAITAGDESKVAYPDGYRNWTHVKSMVIQPGHGLYEAFGGIHHLYANDKALTGYEGHKFPDGAIIVFDLLEAQSEGNAITEGARKVLGVMEKDSERFAETGGWGFEGFAGGDPTKPVVEDPAIACYQCHTSQADRDYVFSDRRE